MLDKHRQYDGGAMKQPKYFIQAIFVLVLGLGLIFSISTAQDTPVFRIGVIDDERGSIAQGARVAVDEINAGGGVVGADGTAFQLELVIQPADTEGNIEGAVANIQQAEVIAVLGPADTDPVLNNLELLGGIGVPVITPAIGDTILASDTAELLFRSRATEFLQGRALALYLTEDLGLTNFMTVQLDVPSTAAVVGFSTAATALEAAPQENLLFTEGTQVSDLVNDIIGATPEAVAVYGTPEVAADLYTQLRQAGWTGIFAYNQAQSAEFREALPLADLAGIIGTDTWSTGLTDIASQAFIVRFVNATGEAPDAIAAATYDSVNLIALALSEPGALQDNLTGLEGIEGAQGVLTPIDLARGETSDNVLIVRLNRFGGSTVVARFAGSTRIPIGDDGAVTVDEGTLEPTLTPTLEGVFVIIRSPQQNIRTGPGTQYEVLGQLLQGETRAVTGANIDFSWVTIDYRGQNGWLSTAPNLLELVGDRETVPVVTPPPLPTPIPITPTVTPVIAPGTTAGPISVPVIGFPDIVVVSATPNELPPNTSINITVTIRNNGDQNAGPFAVAASFPPNNDYSAQNFPGLAAGQQQTFNLQVDTGAATGNYQAVIVADLNQEVNEGPTGEANNSSFQFTYRIDRPTAISSVVTLNANTPFDLDPPSAADITFDANGLNATAPCTGTAFCIGLLGSGLNFNTAHYDAISGTNGINANAVATGSLSVGTTLGVITDTGRRAVLRVDAINPGVSITLTYRVYSQ
jgi:ABC-type branched-subunit amino acid transport system substrate-binding protein/uncharacterized protein YgiM (DUF1202 family)